MHQESDLEDAKKQFGVLKGRNKHLRRTVRRLKADADAVRDHANALATVILRGRHHRHFTARAGTVLAARLLTCGVSFRPIGLCLSLDVRE